MKLQKSVTNINLKIQILVNTIRQLFNIGRGIENYCTTMNMRAEFKSDAKYDLVKDLNIEKD